MENTNPTHNPHLQAMVPTQAMQPYLPPAIRDYIIRNANLRGVGPDPLYPRP